MSRWFRHYAGMMRDEKLVRAAMKSKQTVERVGWVWGAILESAAEINDGGRFDFDVDEAAYFLRCEPGELNAIIGALCDLGRVSDGRVTKWGERQFDSDASRERQKRYRDRQKASRDDDSDVTPPSPDGGVTLQETETDTKSEIQTAPSVPEAASARDFFGEVWEAFPQNPSSSETKARASFDRIKVADWPAVVEAAMRYAKWFAQDCVDRDRTVDAGRRYVPHLAKWLDSGEWREAAKLIIRGEADPDLAVVEAGSADFAAIEKLRGKPIMVGQSGRVTVRKAELERARQPA